MTAPLEADLELAPAPGPDTLVVPSRLVVPRHAHLNSRYGDPAWSLAPLIDDPSSLLRSIIWASFPQDLREELRLITWTFLNGELPNTFVRARGRRMRTRIAVATTVQTVGIWRRLAVWLDGQGVRTLADCDRDLLGQYAPSPRS
ncbi:hypothetical protein ABT095_27810 [Kitasatospora sp. NPDC002227]|uniref:hypothetical protein n=1 Tax=Kitasatospora sp. NPDC002227 TaxID=3154773 RepID=UPI00332CFC80